jgi:hypothetical protein
MAFLKNKKYIKDNGAGDFERIDLKISVSVDGYFTTRIDEKYRDCAMGVLEHEAIEASSLKQQSRGAFRISFNSLDDLDQGIDLILAKYCNPQIKRENVIRYKIENSVCFAENKEGEMAQNATKDGFSWNVNDKERFGGIGSTKNDSYNIKVYARALVKTTKIFGEHKIVDYRAYYGGGSNLGNENPAEKLNSWANMGISYKEKLNEIPYSDKSALFFNDLIWGMVKLAKLIQDHTFNKNDLLKTIASKQKLLSFKKE